MIGSYTYPSRGGSILIGCAAFAILGLGTLAWAQDRGATIAKDAIFARKILMDTISTNMDELETKDELR